MAEIIEIDRLDQPGPDVYAKLTDVQLRSKIDPEKGIFIAESPKVIDIALAEGYEPLSILTEHKHIAGDAADIISRCGDIPVYTGDRALLETMTGYKLTRAVLCAMRRKKLPAAEEICAGARRVAVLEGVTDATNIGAIFRSAAALNIDAVLLTPTCCDPLQRRSIRVSMGTVFKVPWTTLGTNCTEWPHPGLERLNSMGFRTAAMALKKNSVSIDDVQLMKEEKLAIILGTEGDGLAHSTIAGCDYTVMIPMAHGVDSLNVAAAGAVAFWQLRAR